MHYSREYRYIFSCILCFCILCFDRIFKLDMRSEYCMGISLDIARRVVFSSSIYAFGSFSCFVSYSILMLCHRTKETNGIFEVRY